MPFLSWAELHGAITHMPVAFLLAVPVFEIGALVLRKPEWRTVSFWLLAGAVLLALPALVTGWITADDLKFTGTPVAPPPTFLQHRLAAFTTTILALALLYWRVKTQDRLQGKTYFASVALALLAASLVGVTGFLGGRMVFGSGGQESTYVPLESTALKSKAVVPVVKPELVVAGRKLFQELPCQSCHRMEGKGGISGPDLTHEAQRHADPQWHIAHLKDPAKMSPGSDMPSFDTLTPGELEALAAYLSTRE